MNQNNSTTIKPFLVVSNAEKAIEFYTINFGAVVCVKHKIGNNKLICQIAIEGAEFWVGDNDNDTDVSPKVASLSSIVRLVLNTKNADSLFNNAIKNGATLLCPMTTENVWRIGRLIDPFGHVWEIGYIL
ncbi:MAG: VOC family protein [Chlorobiota bacterium]|nr:VOC family protein [Chlorobiota bacterium]QQS67248.1 MAG: VOC family protein [Chlorobiota bacterium]